LAKQPNIVVFNISANLQKTQVIKNQQVVVNKCF